ncbi:hypothetical protein Poly51_24240 [Rubripirellula tenax]|uniref:Uncharacterized protein n=1 Tax=Rubripirellula tenax TaxID=2528015 RepID=A0A5C6F431_9BACT|nr:hypothetical protein [Rubripirellula tenax]TWU56513.1 hypothetical protein Poly51_24240 [Rubripirellula tenax]
MRTRSNQHSITRGLGIVFWVSAMAIAWWGVRSSGDDAAPPVHRTLIRYFSGAYFSGAGTRFEAIDPSSRLKPNDPVFLQDDSGEWSQVGFVQSLAPRGDKTSQLVIGWNHPDWDVAQCQWTQYRSSGRLEDIVATMLPDDQREKIARRLSDAMAMHGDQLAAAYVPLVQLSFQRSLPIIEDEFRRSIGRHRGEVDQLVARWNDQVMKDRLIPLARREILPIVRQHGEPEAEKIGRELWDKASIWRFGWRAVYDRSPLPKKDLLQEEWDRFVEEQAIPVFESHMDDVVVAVQEIITDVAANGAIRSELAEVATEIAADPQARELVRTILKETFVDNVELRNAWTEVWTSDDARRAFALTSERLEPVARQIGDDLFGTQEEGINPNFARVLRNQILGKDRRWIVVRLAETTNRDGAPPVIGFSNEPMPYPIVYMANEDDSK